MLKNTITLEQYNGHMEKLTSFLIKTRGDIEEIKKKKWHRDLNDYATGRVYFWNSSPNNPDDRRPPMRRFKEFDKKGPGEKPFLGSRPTPTDSGGNQREGPDGNAIDHVKTRGQMKASTQRTNSTKKMNNPETRW